MHANSRHHFIATRRYNVLIGGRVSSTRKMEYFGDESLTARDRGRTFRRRAKGGREIACKPPLSDCVSRETRNTPQSWPQIYEVFITGSFGFQAQSRPVEIRYAFFFLQNVTDG